MPFSILAHIIFGIIAFAGSLSLGVSFGGDFKSLKSSQKIAVILSYVGGILSSILGIANMANTSVTVGLSIALVAFTLFVFRGVFAKVSKAELSK